MTMKKLFLFFLPVLVLFALAGLPSQSTAQTSDQDFGSAVEQFRQSRQTLRDARAQEASEASEVGKAKVQAQRDLAEQRREEARLRMEEKRKEVLSRLLDIQIKHLNRTNERVQRMPNISDDLKVRLAAEINTDIARLQDYATEVGSATGREEIKTLARQIKDFFRSYRETVQMIVDAIHTSRANGAVATAGDRAAAMKAKIQALKNEGQDTSELEEEIDDIQGDLDNVQEQIGRKAFREANEDLKGVYQKFRDIAQKAKGLE